jgi:hypothetical protein
MRQYPRQCFVLTPTFQLKEITITNGYSSHAYPDYDQVQDGKIFHVDELYASKQEALDAGERKVNERQTKLTKMQTRLNKCADNIALAQAKLNQEKPSV